MHCQRYNARQKFDLFITNDPFCVHIIEIPFVTIALSALLSQSISTSSVPVETSSI